MEKAIGVRIKKTGVSGKTPGEKSCGNVLADRGLPILGDSPPLAKVNIPTLTSNGATLGWATLWIPT